VAARSLIWCAWDLTIAAACVDTACVDATGNRNAACEADSAAGCTLNGAGSGCAEAAGGGSGGCVYIGAHTIGAADAVDTVATWVDTDRVQCLSPQIAQAPYAAAGCVAAADGEPTAADGDAGADCADGGATLCCALTEDTSACTNNQGDAALCTHVAGHAADSGRVAVAIAVGGPVIK
jgi:hypothetical protein